MLIRKILAGAAVVAALVPSGADGYSFIVDESTYPAADEPGCVAKSAGTSFEARFRTWEESEGRPLRSDPYQATLIIIR